VSFAHPVLLILLVLLPLLGAGALLMARLRKNQWRLFVAPRLRGALIKHGSSLPRWFSLFLLLTACAAMIVALARPQADAGTRTEKSLGRNVLVALDLSRSMRVKDVQPDRLSQAKIVIYELLDAMPNERIGLIGFAGNSYLYAPLTIDHAAVRETVQQIDETWPPLGGSYLASAIRLAIDTFRKTGQQNNALVILSDGDKHGGDLDDMINEAENAGVYILAIGVGTEDGEKVPNPASPNSYIVDRKGQQVISRLQPEVMRELATRTKGRYAVAGSGMDIPAMVKSSVKDLDAFEVEGRERKISIEFYQWLLLPAIVFLLGSIAAATRWRGIRPAAISAALLLTPGAARADDVSSARDALENGRFIEAREAYRKLAEDTPFASRRARFHLGEATAAYRGGDFKSARAAYSKSLLADDPAVAASSHLGLGDSLFQLGWRTLSGDAYPKEPPDMEKFDTIVRDLLDKLKEAPDGETPSYEGIETLVTNWTDAVRHFDSAARAGEKTSASNNRALTMAYLNRLRELLDEDKEKTEQSMPQPGQGEPKQGEDGSQPKEEGDGEGDEGEKPEGNQGDGEEKDKEGSNGDEDKESDKPGGDKESDKDSDKKGKGQKPDETPEDRARRILKENADLEKGPLTPGRREFRDPEKDW
jgi:Ca-activated chloride channel homolog